MSTIAVKNVRILESMSEETLCFEATVYVDGQRFGTCGNEGRGGPNTYHFESPALRARFDEVVAQIAAERGEDTRYEFEDTLIVIAVDTHPWTVNGEDEEEPIGWTSTTYVALVGKPDAQRIAAEREKAAAGGKSRLRYLMDERAVVA